MRCFRSPMAVDAMTCEEVLKYPCFCLYMTRTFLVVVAKGGSPLDLGRASFAAT
jgi:hypothetical protein